MERCRSDTREGVAEGVESARAGFGDGANAARWSSDAEQQTRGGSDDIGDVSWNVPTVSLRYPSNIPGLPGHNWTDAIAMATPIAHKGVTAGAKVVAMTMIDLLTKPELVEQAWKYFREVQTKDTKYQPLIGAGRQTADVAEPTHDGHISRADAEVLLQPVEVRHISRAVGDQVLQRHVTRSDYDG